MANMDKWQLEFTNYLAGGTALLESIFQGLQQRFTFLQNARFGQDISQQLRDFSEHFSDKHLSNMVYGLATWLPSLLLTDLTFFMLRCASLRENGGRLSSQFFFEKTLYLIHAIDRTANSTSSAS